MAKTGSGTKDQGSSVAAQSGGSPDGGSGNEGGPVSTTGKKPRKPGVKYTNLVRSEYKPAPEGQTLNLLDERVTVVKGSIKLPGVICKNVFGENILLVPTTQTAFKEPTLRQLIAYLTSLEAK